MCKSTGLKVGPALDFFPFFFVVLFLYDSFFFLYFHSRPSLFSLFFGARLLIRRIAIESRTWRQLLFFRSRVFPNPPHPLGCLPQLYFRNFPFSHPHDTRSPGLCNSGLVIFAQLFVVESPKMFEMPPPTPFAVCWTISNVPF